MQTKKLSRIFAVVMTVALIALAPLFFAGCDSTISIKDAVKNAKDATVAYLDGHATYSTFKDATYASTTKSVNVEFETVDNVKKETVTTTTTEKTLSIKNVSETLRTGKLTVIETVTTQTNAINGAKGNAVTNKTKTEFNIANAKLNSATEDSYYITKLVTPLLVNGAESNEAPTKQIAAFANKEAYDEAINYIIDTMNERTLSVLGNLGEAEGYAMMGDMVSTTKSGDTTKIAYEMTGFEVQDFDEINVKNFVSDTTMAMDIAVSKTSASTSMTKKDTTPGTTEEYSSTYSYKTETVTPTIATDYTGVELNVIIPSTEAIATLLPAPQNMM